MFFTLQVRPERSSSSWCSTSNPVLSPALPLSHHRVPTASRKRASTDSKSIRINRQKLTLSEPLRPQFSDLFTPCYSMLNKIFRQIPTNTGLGGISGHFTKKWMVCIFEEIDSILKSKRLEWNKQHFYDVGFGEGYPIICASRLCPASGIDIDKTVVHAFNENPKKWMATDPCCVFPVAVELKNVLKLKKIPDKVTILYSFNSAFPPRTNDHILKLIEKAPNLVCVVLAQEKAFGWGNVVKSKMAGSGETRPMIVVPLPKGRQS